MSTTWCIGVITVVTLLVGGLSPRVSAQSADSTRARLQLGAEFLKAGDIELATKTFLQVADADPTNWQARSLLALAHLSSGQLDQAEIELGRLRTVKAPQAAIDTVERQVNGRKRSNQIRDELTQLLQLGKSEEALARIDSESLQASSKQLLRAYVAMLRGNFDEASRLTDGPAFADFNARLKQRAEEHVTARQAALVAMNYLGRRYCGPEIWDMRLCEDHPALTAADRATWNTIRSGSGKVNAVFMTEDVKSPSWEFVPWVQQMLPQTVSTFWARDEVALGLISRFVSMAPLHSDALQAATIMALYSGSRETMTVVAQRSINESGVWALKTRQCSFRIFWHACGIGDEKMSKDLRSEGMLVLDTRARLLRFHTVQPSAWLTSVRPELGAVKFQLPFDQIKILKSRPRAEMKNGTGPWFDNNAVLFDFGGGKTVPMYLDFTFDLSVSDAVAVMFRALEDATAVMAELLPNETLDFKSELKGTTFGDSFTRAVGIAGVVLGSAGVANAGATGQQILTAQQGIDTANQRALSSVWQTATELRAKDGRSMMEAATEVEGLRQDVEALLELALR